MAKPNISSPGIDLPEYLGFGMLDPKTVRRSDDLISASYFHGKDLVYLVKRNLKHAFLEEYYQNKIIARTQGETLQQAFLQNLGSLETYRHPRMRDIFQPLMQQWNIHIDMPYRFTTLFYPAGILLGLRLPLEKDRIKSWISKKAGLTGKESPLKLESDQEGFLLCLKERGEVRGEPVVLLEFTTALVNIQIAIKVLSQSGLIGKNKEMRLIITDCSRLDKELLTIYLGDRGKGNMTYALAPISQKTKPDELAKKFYENSLQFLDTSK